MTICRGTALTQEEKTLTYLLGVLTVVQGLLSEGGEVGAESFSVSTS